MEQKLSYLKKHIDELANFFNEPHSIEEKQLVMQQLIEILPKNSMDVDDDDIFASKVFLSMAKNLTEGLLFIDNQVIKYANPAALSFFNIHSNEVKSVNLSSIFSIEDIQLIFSQLEIESGDLCIQRECKITLTGNQIREIELKAFRLSKAGQSLKSIFIFEDVTDIRLERAAIRKTQSRMNMLTSISPVGFAYMDKDGKIIECNPSFLNMLELTDESGVTNLFKDKLFIEIGISGDAINAMLEKKQVCHERWYQRFKKKIYLSYNFTPLIENDSVVGILGDFVDLTAQKLAEEELAAGREMFESILNAVPDIILVLSRDGEYKQAFVSELQNVLVSAELLKHKSIKDFVDPEVSKQLIDTISYVIDNDTIEQFEYPIFLNNKNHWYEARIAPLKMQGSENALWIARDITDRKDMLKALNQAKEKAEESDLLKSAFLANMSHEIRTPLNGMLGIAELMKDRVVDENERHEYLNIITSSGYDLLNIINDIIDISKIEANLLTISPIHFSLNDLFYKLDKFYQIRKGQMNKQAISVKKQIGLSDGDDIIISDESRVYQVLSNLLQNALKYTQEGLIEYGYLLLDNSKLMFYVKDSGIGIPDDKRELIFERFRQVDDSQTRMFGGTGLGLSICKRLVELMDGDIWFESVLGKGSIFYFTLPYKCGASANSEKNIKPTFARNWNDKTIFRGQ